jgi:hypothetical protein
MKRIALVAVVLILTILLGCSPKAPVTSPTTQETSLPAASQETQTSASSPATSDTTQPSLSTTSSLPTISPSPTRPSSPTSQTPTQITPLPPLGAFMKGIHFNDWKPFDTLSQWRGLFPSPGTDQSIKDLAATGANWISITIIFGQETVSSTTMFRDSPATATDAELLRVINLAHNLGMRVMFLPSLALSDDPDHWWGQIGGAFNNETQWQDWFASYSEIINHYASFAQEADVDMLSIGRELGGITHREEEWRQVIKEVREHYKGPLTYSSLSSGEYANIKWWDAVDYIGVNGYFLLTNSNNPTVTELKTAWIDRGYIAALENLSNQYNKPIVITEIGYIDQDGTNKVPGDFWINTPTDLQEQADCYQAAFEVLWGKPWLKGIFWWQWSATSAAWPENPQGKPAEEVLKQFYLSQ